MLQQNNAPPLVRTRAVAAEHAAAADRDRRLDDSVVAAIKAAGFPGHFVAKEHGGAAGGYTEFVDSVLTVAEGCASAGWCASLFASHARLAGYLPEEGRADIWPDGATSLVGAAFVPSGEVTPAEGGWTLSGRWKFVSGVDFADWVLIFARDTTAEPPELRVFAVPAGEFEVEDTWFTSGMRGTGSRTVVLDGVFVPRRRTFRQKTMLDGAAETPDAPAHRVPFRLVNGLTMVTPAIGAARGALALWTEWIAGKTEVAMGTVLRSRDKAGVRFALTRAAAELDAAELLVRRTAATGDEAGKVPAELVARSHRDHAIAAELAVSAVDRIQNCSGTSGQEEGNPLQRHWRDVHAAASHAALQFETAAGVYANHVFGT